MYRVDYFQRLNGRKPAEEWIKAQSSILRVSIFAKIKDLKNEGINLLGNNVLHRITGAEPGMYELRNVGLNWRIGVYHDKRNESFILLHGWRHDKSHKKERLVGEIEKARQYLAEYLKMEQRRYG